MTLALWEDVLDGSIERSGSCFQAQLKLLTSIGGHGVTWLPISSIQQYYVSLTMNQS